MENLSVPGDMVDRTEGFKKSGRIVFKKLVDWKLVANSRIGILDHI